MHIVCAHCACVIVQWCHLREMKTRTLSKEERRIIVGMRSIGLSAYYFARELEMSLSTVFIVSKNYCGSSTMAEHKPKERPQKLSICDKKDLRCILTQNHCLSFVGII